MVVGDLPGTACCSSTPVPAVSSTLAEPSDRTSEKGTEVT
jgi:hypothetical protein